MVNVYKANKYIAVFKTQLKKINVLFLNNKKKLFILKIYVIYK